MVIADLPGSADTEKSGMPVLSDTEESVKLSETTSADESYGEWADWQTTDVTKIREFFTSFGYNDTQTAVDKGIVNVQRRFSTSDPALSQLKFENVFGDVDLIADVSTAGEVKFPDQDTGIPNISGGSYETYHFFTQYYTNYTCYADGMILLNIWALIDPNRGYYKNLVDIVFPGKWGEPVEMGRYIPDQENYESLKSLISGFGNEATVWEDAVDVDCRDNLDFPNRKLYTFHKLVAGSDVRVDQNKFSVVRTTQNTGLIYGGENHDGTEELKFYPYALKVFETIYSIDLTLVFSAASDNNSYARPLHFTKEGHEMFSSDIKGESFISSTQQSATFSTPHSGEVDEWRLYVLTSGVGVYNEFRKAMQGEEAKISYAVVDGESTTIPCDTLVLKNELCLVPMNNTDGKMKQSGPNVSFIVYRNAPLEGEWEVWGEGRMTDVVAFPYLKFRAGEEVPDDAFTLMPPAERKVRIERRKDAPGIIRIPDPYKGDYPYKDKMEMMDTDDTFYLVIDTTDPSRVTAEETLTGTSDCAYFSFDDYSTMIPKYGKCLDRKVIFRDGLKWRTDISNNRPDLIPQLSLELPGYRDFTVEITGLSDDGKEVEIENKSEHIVSVDMALVSDDNYDKYYPERSCELVMNGSEALFIHNHPVKKGGTVSVKIADLARSGAVGETLPTGRYRVVVVPREADGTQHYGPVSDEVRYIAPWKHIGEAEINDQALVWSPANAGVDMKAEAYEDPYNQGFYMLKECYKDYAANNTDTEKNQYSEYVASSLYIDARDPEKVNLVADAEFGSLPYRGFNTGVSLNLDPDTNGYNGYHYINTMGNFNNSSDNNEYGKKEGDYIKFDRNSLVTTWDKGGFYYANYLTIKLPHVDDDAVDGVESDADASAPVQWYNLQGVRVDIDNVPSGVYIRRQGNAASKVAVRR